MQKQLFADDVISIEPYYRCGSLRFAGKGGAWSFACFQFLSNVMPSHPSRREFLTSSAAALSLLPLASLAETSTTAANQLRVLCIGAHPDDPETGCGGTLAKLAVAGHAVSVLYLTRGEAGIPGKTHGEAAAIRSAEAEAACRILGARPFFFGQIDGSTEINDHALQAISERLAHEQPDLIFTHWPIDSHRDHQVASLLATHGWMKSDRRAVVYYFEVCAGQQTMVFKPTDYVDITAVQAQKRQAVFCHESQQPAQIYGEGAHDAMEDFRGREIGVKAGEAFIRLAGSGHTSIV